MKSSLFAIFLLITSLPAFAQLTNAKKKDWLQELKTCTQNCQVRAETMLKEYAKLYPSARLSLNRNAQSTFLYLHSYTMNPSELRTFHEKFIQDKKTNFFAPIFTAHQKYSTPDNFMNVKPEEWILDAELAFHMVHALGLPVTIQGFSMGGMAAIGLADRYSDKIQKMVLIAPAIMIANGGDDVACAGRNSVIKSTAKTLLKPFIKPLSKRYSVAIDDAYIEKFLNGACPLSRMIKLIRSRHSLPIQSDFASNPVSDIQIDRYNLYIEQVENLASHIQVPTLLIYSNDDEAVDTRALLAFSRKLPKGKVLTLNGGEKVVRHLGIYSNPVIPATHTPVFSEMRQYILRH